MMPSRDQTGVPLHFHSSTTSGTASRISLRIVAKVSPRQSPSSAILFEISFDADWPWLASGFFMSSSSKCWISGLCQCAGWLFVPFLLSMILPRNRVQNLRIAGLLKCLERLPAHRGIYMEIGRPHDCTELFQKEKDCAVLDQRSPIPTAYHRPLLFCQSPFLEHRFRIVEKALAPLGLNERVQKVIQPVCLDAAAQRERISSGKFFDARPLGANPLPVFTIRLTRRPIWNIFVDDRRNRRHRRQVVRLVQLPDC